MLYHNLVHKLSVIIHLLLDSIITESKQIFKIISLYFCGKNRYFKVFRRLLFTVFVVFLSVSAGGDVFYAFEVTRDVFGIGMAEFYCDFCDGQICF